MRNDLAEFERFKQLSLLLKRHRPETLEPASKGPRELGQAHLEVLWHAKMVHKATVIAERLHDLHNRVDQYLLRTNPDHPDPTLRRRTENGLGDRYLNELCRWTHRDLARFVVTRMGAHYPYQQVPSTFQFWAYDFTSWHHSFVGFDGHGKWQKAIDDMARAPRDLRDLLDPGRPTGKEMETPEKFSMVAMSYWMPERPTFQPIVAHELAHQVLRDLYGRELNLQILEHDPSQMSRLMRRITRCVETWLTQRDDAVSKPPKVLSSLVQEVVCDLLALARFGSAYLYAWLLEILSDEAFTALFHDRFGMIRPFPAADCAQFEQALIQQQKVIQELKPLLLQYADEVPTLYLRGAVLLKMAMSARGSQKDDLADHFLEGFESMVDLLADIASAGDAARWEYNHAFATDLAAVVVRSRAPRGSDLSARADNPADRQRLLQQVKSPLAAAIQAWWSEPQDEGLKLQQMSEDMLSLVNDALPDIGSGCAQTMGPMSIAQVPWRLEWLHSQGVVLAQDAPFGETPRGRRSVALIRSLLMIGMEDYLRRTASPGRLLLEVADGQEQKKAVERRLQVNNSFRDESLAKFYDTTGVAALDDFLAKPESERVDWQIVLPAAHDQRAMPLPLNRAVLDRLVPPLTGSRTLSILQATGTTRPARVQVLELFRLRTRTLLRGDIRVVPDPQAAQAPDRSRPPARSGALLGRYDAFVLLDKEAVVEGESPWIIGALGEEAQASDGCKPIHVARSKRLIPVGCSGQDSGRPDTLALVMVSLRWEGARLPVARWLDQQRARLGQPDVYMSDGWEDLVLVMTVSPEPTDTQLAAGYQQLFGLLRELHDHPMVASTETLLSPLALRAAGLCGISAHFVCSFGLEGGTQVWQTIQTIQTHFDGCKALNLAGNKDIVVVPGHPTQLPGLHRELHGSLDNGCRVETQVAWPQHVRDAPAPAA
ncbi:MAG: hypothetical protein J0M20_01035 [Burkholderiales bacterium]|nr:hypothetical protein [Burkholderiales bacterium]